MSIKIFFVDDEKLLLESLGVFFSSDRDFEVVGSAVSAEEALVSYIKYMGSELGFGIAPRQGVYSSDSTPFADKGVPAVSLARIAGGLVAPIHVRYDTMEVMSMAQMEKDIAFIAEFTRRMAVSAACPVSRTIPESVRKELDEYLFKKRKEH
ncbi:MAG: hypothetical protein IJ926_02320 [Firmicutes bacterium]|nr:hypothetical protein [Bacillota bacterium]